VYFTSEFKTKAGRKKVKDAGAALFSICFISEIFFMLRKTTFKKYK
jgi:cbb3-type cytochrome oxidase subunit 3